MKSTSAPAPAPAEGPLPTFVFCRMAFGAAVFVLDVPHPPRPEAGEKGLALCATAGTEHGLGDGREEGTASPRAVRCELGGGRHQRGPGEARRGTRLGRGGSPIPGTPRPRRPGLGPLDSQDPSQPADLFVPRGTGKWG